MNQSFWANYFFYRRKFESWCFNRKLKAWVKRLAIHQGVKIDEQLDVTGRADFDKWISFEKGAHLEKQTSIWLSEDSDANPDLMFSNSYIGRNCFIGVHAPISIGKNSIVGAYSYIISANHKFDSRTVPIRSQGYTSAPIQIGEDAWIGCNCTILPGTNMGNGSILGAGSVLTTSTGQNEIWGGVPARKIKDRP